MTVLLTLVVLCRLVLARDRAHIISRLCRYLLLTLDASALSCNIFTDLEVYAVTGRNIHMRYNFANHNFDNLSTQPNRRPFLWVTD